MVENLIFDIDGTLWDATEAITASWNEVVKRSELSCFVTLKEMRSYMGLLLSEIGRRVFKGVPEEEIKGYVEQCLAEQAKRLGREGKIYPGVGSTLETLSQKYGVYIVSNCMGDYIGSLFERLGEAKKFVDGWLCAGDTGKDKAENLSLLQEKYGLKNCAYVGDTSMDEQACRKAGVPFIHAAYGFGTAESPAATIRDFPSVIRVAERL